MAKPVFERSGLRPGILHLGIGAFHRAHQATYTEAVLATGDLRWGTVGASLRSPRARDTLTPQDFLYTVCQRHQDHSEAQIIGGLVNVLCGAEPAGYGKLIQTIANPATRVITLTITEKGYCHDHDGNLDERHADVLHDLEQPTRARSAPGLLTAGLVERRHTGAPLTIVSCDNVTGNGTVARRVVTTMARARDPSLAAWIQDHIAFPSTMVDRIVPRTAPEDIERVRGEFGYTDEALVVCEPFRQWVMEDQFMGPRPAWEAAGAELVGDVAPYEQAKLRLLNASHSLLAYLGLLLGYEFIHEVIGDADLANFARRVLVDEVVPTIDLPSGFDLAGYIDATLERFANTAVAYRAAQVASDGSHKLVQRIYPTLRARVERGLPAPGMELAVCAWLQCLTGRAEDGTAIGFDDPGAKPVGRLVATHHDPRALVDAIDQDTNHWDSVQAQHRDELRKRLANSLQALRQQGVHGRINALMATPAQPA